MRITRFFLWLRLLAAGLILGCGLLGGAGCVSRNAAKRGMQPGLEAFLVNVRPASGDASRLLSNARYYRLMGRPDLALKQLEEAYRQDPKNLKVVNTLAQSYEGMGEFERARQLYGEAQQPGYHPVLSNNACFSYYLEGKYDQAEACFLQVLARDPRNTAALNNLGLVWCRQGRLKEAHRLWTEAEGEDAAQAKLGQALEALGKEPKEIYAWLQRSKTPGAQQARTPKPEPSSPGSTGSPPVLAEARPAAGSPVPRQTTGKRNKPADGDQLALSHHPANQSTTTPTPEAAPPPAPRSAPSARKPLSSAELLGTAIEVRNGTPTRDLARRTRSLLEQNGFSVARIGNHLDFGAQCTVIYYREGAERVARALQADFFPASEIQPSSKLKKQVDIKILLGHDLLARPQMMARLTGRNN